MAGGDPLELAQAGLGGVERQRAGRVGRRLLGDGAGRRRERAERHEDGRQPAATRGCRAGGGHRVPDRTGHP